jgi:ketosteroid isomerase-like protein
MNNSLQVAIEKVKEKFVKAYHARNAGKIADLYSSEGILYPANGAIVAGRSSIKSYYKQGFANEASDFVFESKDLYQGLSKLVATEVGHYHFVLSETQVAGNYIIIWRLEADGWRLYRAMWTIESSRQKK